MTTAKPTEYQKGSKNGGGNSGEAHHTVMNKKTEGKAANVRSYE